ncbi:MAG TPA: DUF6526 family protein [Terracidiphilus sp.]|nr:DUF6526 family protein [Terracidiphilus sp.]
MSKPQDFKHHARFDPLYHFFLAVVAIASIVMAIIHVFRHPSFYAGWMVVLAIAALVLLFRLRTYPLKVQDRVIRLEEQLRLQSLAPPEWRGQIHRLTEDQLIGLRFAGDDEVVELAKQALEQHLNRKQIKERIRNWRADEWRV